MDRSSPPIFCPPSVISRLFGTVVEGYCLHVLYSQGQIGIKCDWSPIQIHIIDFRWPVSNALKRMWGQNQWQVSHHIGKLTYTAVPPLWVLSRFKFTFMWDFQWWYTVPLLADHYSVGLAQLKNVIPMELGYKFLANHYLLRSRANPHFHLLVSLLSIITEYD